MRKPDDSAAVLAVAGLAREARIAAGEGVVTVQAGGRPAVLRESLAALSDAPLRAVVSFGIAGGLDPTLAPGDVVIGSGVTVGEAAQPSFACDPCLAEGFARALAGLRTRVVTAGIVGAEAAVLMPATKAALRARTGAAIVDMESHVAAAYAATWGLPFAVLRVVCDPASRALPAFAAAALKPNGDPNIPAVLAALARREATLSELIRLARDSGAAFRALGRARALLGLALGVDP